MGWVPGAIYLVLLATLGLFHQILPIGSCS